MPSQCFKSKNTDKECQSKHYECQCQSITLKSKRLKDTERLADDIQKLKEYLRRLEYCPKEPVLFSDRTERLAQPTLKCLKGTYDNFKTTLPKYKTQMLREDLDKLDTRNITTEQLKEYMERRAETEKELIRSRRNRFIEFQKTLSVIEAQCRESVMKDIVQKFAQYVANRTIKNDYPTAITEPHQRLCRGLVCNMLMSLGINNNACHHVDTSLFEGLANVLADILLKTLHKIQIIDPDEYELPIDVPDIKCNQIDCISKRAQRAVRKNAKKIETKIDDDLNKLKMGKMDNDIQFKLFLKSQCKPNKMQCDKTDTTI